MQSLSDMLYEYAFDINHKLVHIDDVDNGCNCNCTCPCCGEKMIARNGGKIREHHFAHSSGTDCVGYRETLLHILSKQIIQENKTIVQAIYKQLKEKEKLSNKEVEEILKNLKESGDLQ